MSNEEILLTVVPMLDLTQSFELDFLIMELFYTVDLKKNSSRSFIYLIISFFHSLIHLSIHRVQVKEEIAMRELLEQDHRERIESLKKENNEMKLVVAHYEKTIVELTGMYIFVLWHILF